MAYPVAMRIPRRWLVCLMTLFLLALPALLLPATWPSLGLAVAQAEPPDDTPEGGDDEPGDFFEGETTFSAKEANKAIAKGVSWLRKKQARSGSWGEVKAGAIYGGGDPDKAYKHPAGPTALALYALLKCKVSERDPLVKNGFAYIKKHWPKPRGSYETSVLLLAICATADHMKTSRASKASAKRKVPKLSSEFRKWAGKLVDHLISKRVDRAWRYQVNDPGATHGGENDLSSTQLATLALFSAHQLGIRVKPKYWEDILSYSMEQQADQGAEMVYVDPATKEKRIAQARGFSYMKGDPTPKHGQPSGSMTACGLANVMMARFVLTDGARQRKRWDKRADAAKVQASVYDGLAWLDHNWSPFDNPPGRPFNYHVYYLYSLERAMDLIGDQLVGKHAWYSEMGQELINRQDADGHWNSNSTHEPKDTLDTCFALLFLKRATKDVIPFPSITGGSDEAPAENR